jgi:CheY-like chemotaxis protein
MEALGQLAKGLAPELNSWLTVISGYSQFLLSRQGSRPGSREELMHIQRASTRAAAVLQELLTLSGPPGQQNDALDLNAQVAACAQMLRPLLADAIEVRTSLTEPLPAVRARPGQILHLVLSLAAYARSVMPGGGRLTLATALAEPISLEGVQAAGSSDTLVDEPPAGEAASALPAARPPHSSDMREVVLSVSDTSSGMDEETRSRMCELLANCSSGGGGVGLGVATAAEVVKQMNGRMGIASTPARGTTFTVFLPAVQDDAIGSRWRGHETILVAEDTLQVRQLIERLLTDSGYQVLTAADGLEALTLAQQLGHPIDLLIADVGLPRRSGPDVAAGLRALCHALRVLYISGYPLEHSESFNTWGPVEFLQKPFKPDALLRKVRQILGPTAQ